MKNKRSNLLTSKCHFFTNNLYFLKFFMLVLIIYGCKDKADWELNQLYEIHPYLRFNSWEELYREHYPDYDIVILRRNIVDTNIYLHYTIFANKTENRIKFSNVFTHIEYFDSVYFHEIKIKSGVDTLYDLIYPKNGVDFNNPAFRRDTLNLLFEKGKDYYLDLYLLRPTAEKVKEWKNKQDTSLPVELEPLREIK